MFFVRYLLYLFCKFNNCNSLNYFFNNTFCLPWKSNLFFFEQDYYECLKSLYFWIKNYPDFNTLRASFFINIYYIFLITITSNYFIFILECSYL
uniref:Uncharacterized protein n=1 Tax=Euplotes vanleeuwenhoeki TaxID=2794224 RepID=A0A7T1FUE2_9SPIT|nr:hypothetical protein KQ443_mgp07 [Euplotes vanleeuwenhoeki]QPM99271.1 hypothetical protein MitoLV_45 [Euplotes vanleeuwenhoeki]